MKDKLTMLMILDGFGDNPNKDGNAIKMAKTPNIDKLMKKYPNTDIFTSGLHVAIIFQERKECGKWKQNQSYVLEKH